MELRFPFYSVILENSLGNFLITFWMVGFLGFRMENLVKNYVFGAQKVFERIILIFYKFKVVSNPLN